MKKLTLVTVLMLGLLILASCEKQTETIDENTPVLDLKKQQNRDYLRGNPFTMIHGTPGDDLIDSTWTPVPPGDGQDKIIGKDGNDEIYGYAGDDFLIGGDGDDELYGGEGDDKINAGDGSNYIEGNEGNDNIHAGAAGDVVYGNEGYDTVKGGEGADILYGGDDNDELKGGEDDDTLYGDAGDDMLYGGEDDGNDIIHGGDGIDTAVFEYLYADYTITDNGVDHWTIECLLDGSIDEVYYDVEYLKFDDETIDTSTL